MTIKLLIPDNANTQTICDEKNEFMKSIDMGLSCSRKHISSKYFYDEKGSELFNKITRHEDYYLTQYEIKILEDNKKEISTILHHESINIIELGPGEGIKTQILISQLINDKQQFSYFPIDISKDYLKNLMQIFEKTLPTIELTAINCDYFDAIKWLNCTSKKRNCVLFLGSSIGNFDHSSTEIFLQHLHSVLNNGDYVLIGFDLCKDTDILLRAYNDSDGITRDFNFNLLKRVNNELGADFNLKQFSHYASYNVYLRAMESYLLSLTKQTVTINELNKTFHFDQMEPIHVEFSHKYLLSEIIGLAKQFNFEIVKNFTDENNYFVNSFWRVLK